MSSCSKCQANFGLKFNKYECLLCGDHFCSGHLIKKEDISFGPTIDKNLITVADGVCTSCLITYWQKTDKDLEPAKGLFGRTGRLISKSINSFATATGAINNPLQEIRLGTNACESLINKKSKMMLFHQHDLNEEFLKSEIVELARLKAVSSGRDNEKCITLNDVYSAVDWMRSHPKIPNFIHDISWSKIEKSPQALDWVSDAWHIAWCAVSHSNPATMAYHASDRFIDQLSGKGISSHLYDKFSSKLGLNVNVKKGFTCYIAGNIVMRLYEGKT